jgi:hypothetical protein
MSSNSTINAQTLISSIPAIVPKAEITSEYSKFQPFWSAFVITIYPTPFFVSSSLLKAKLVHLRIFKLETKIKSCAAFKSAPASIKDAATLNVTSSVLGNKNLPESVIKPRYKF